ncbi:MAG TPA: hypothetical protein VGK40_12920 [Verrucomicrobiae bacterium]|jgi:hypothetical protein
MMRLAVLLAALGAMAACRSVPLLPPSNFAEPGWTIRQGQTVWRTGQDAPELAGELLVATHRDGRSLVQFTKTPLPFVVAQTTTNSWQVDFVAKNKTYSGRGAPPVRVIWLHLARSLDGNPPPKPFVFEKIPEAGWKLENRATGEMISGYLAR